MKLLYMGNVNAVYAKQGVLPAIEVRECVFSEGRNTIKSVAARDCLHHRTSATARYAGDTFDGCSTDPGNLAGALTISVVV